ncbi:MAG: PQQ-binding-like beta-propeller repeat protein [Candidatus Aenigmatarchaeota archaeon]
MKGAEKTGILAVISIAVLAAFFAFGAMMRQGPVVTAFAPADFQGDLRPISISYSPAGPQTGDNVEFNITVKNVGTEDPAATFVIALYIDDSNVANGTLPSLAAGSTASASMPWTATSELHDVHVIVDPDNVTGGNKGYSRLNSSIAVDWPTAQQNNERWGYANTNISGPLGSKVLWRIRVESDSVANYHTMLATDGMIIVPTQDYVVAVNATTGDEIWEIADISYINAMDATVARGVLFVASYGAPGIFAYNVTDGTQLWNVTDDFYYDMFATGYHNGILINDNHTTITGRNYLTGDKVWEFTPENVTGWNVPGGGLVWDPPAIYNDTFYLTAYESTGGAFAGEIYALDVLTGTRLWNQSFTGRIPTVPSVGYGNVFFGDQDNGMIHAYNISNMTESWSVAHGVASGLNAVFQVYGNAVYFCYGSYCYAHDAVTGSEIWSSYLGLNVAYMTGPVQDNKGVLYVGADLNQPPWGSYVLALNASDGSLLWSHHITKRPMSMVPYNGMLYVVDSDAYLYQFGPKQNLTLSMGYNNSIIDRDSVSNVYPDAIPLVATLSDGASGVEVTFEINQTAPSAYESSYWSLGSNTSVNGVATYWWSPADDHDYAGSYFWTAVNDSYNTLGEPTARVYGSLNTSFLLAGSYPGTSYNSTDNLTAKADITFPWGESLSVMQSNYNLNYNISLAKPDGSRLHSGLYRRANTTVTTTNLTSGTGNSCWDIGGSDLLAFDENLVPGSVPSFSGSQTPPYYFRFTCGSGTCPGYANAVYNLIGSDSPDWWAGIYDYFQLSGWGGCTGTPGTEGDDWTFIVFTNSSSTSYFWNGTLALTNDPGTWTATLNASADFFVRNDTINRTFTVTGTGSSPPSGPSGPGTVTIFNESLSGQIPVWNMNLSGDGDITVVDGINQVTVGRGSTEPLDLTLTNTGNRVLEDITVTAEGIPSEWVTISPSFIEKLQPKESVPISATISIPQFAPFAVYGINFTARSNSATARYDLNTELTDKCKTCQPPGPWGACTEGIWFRTNYRCDSQTDYQCTAWQEEGTCAVVDFLWIVVILIVMTIFTWQYWKHERSPQGYGGRMARQRPLPASSLPLAARPETSSVKKPRKAVKKDVLLVPFDNLPHGKKGGVKTRPRKV